MSFAIVRYNMSTKQNCYPGAEYALARCTVREWLKARVIEPLNCTLFYMQHQAFSKWPTLEVCPPEWIIRHYDQVANVTGLKQTAVPYSTVRSTVRKVTLSTEYGTA
ncbi:hypothetical protein AAVH_23808 [Aphelenchoides avenae]|nr:hypothetical protein AAVH_23808 [Aphelenchus avenae]